MTGLAVLGLYPLWAVCTLIGVTALRLGRAGRGLVALSLVLSAWVAAIILFELPATRALAERAIPAGMLLAGGFVHAGTDIVGGGRRLAVLGYAFGIVVGIAGALDPGLFFTAGLAAPGPLFWPCAAAAAGGTGTTVLWLARAARAAQGRDCRRRAALALGALFGSLGGGGAVAARVLLGVPVLWAAPALLLAVALVTYATVSGEHGRSRRLVGQALAYALMTAALSALGLFLFFRALPWLLPAEGATAAWLLVVIFFAALPLDALRMLIVESAGRRLYPDPIGVRDLADEVARTETRADHAERLAEIGALAGAVAHEIRNPLGIIAAQAKLLERRGADEQSVAALRQQVERARRFLDELLRYSRPRPLEIGAVRVAEALAAAAAGMPDAPPVTLALDGLRDLELDADPGGFHDVHVILLSNAVAALHGRPDPRLVLSAADRGAAVEVSVEDNGPGVPPEIADRLFQPFVSGRGRDSAHPGTGLGLAIAARWLERHGGALRHERPAGGGARFVVTWPKNGPRHA